MHKTIAAAALAALVFAPAHADETSAQVFAAVPAWPQHAVKSGNCDALSAQASALSLKAGQAGAVDQQQVEQAGQASAAEVQARYGAQAEQNRQAGVDVAQRMQALAQKYQGNQQAMLADPEFQQLMQQAQGVNRQVVAVSRQATTTMQPLHDTASQAQLKQQQYCIPLDAQAEALHKRILDEQQAQHARGSAPFKAEVKSNCKMLIGEDGPFPEGSCVEAIAKRHQGEFEACCKTSRRITPGCARVHSSAARSSTGHSVSAPRNTGARSNCCGCRSWLARRRRTFMTSMPT